MIRVNSDIDKKSKKIRRGMIENEKGVDITVAVSMDDPLDEVDAIVVMTIIFVDEIEEKLSEEIDCPGISLEDILYEL